MSLAELKAVGADRGVAAKPFELAEGLLTKPIRSTPDGRLDILDVVENICSTRDAAKTAVNRLFSDVESIGDNKSLSTCFMGSESLKYIYTVYNKQIIVLL